MAKQQFPMDVVCISSGYGHRDLAIAPGEHKAVDLTGSDNKGGDLILAPHNGYVVWAGLSTADKALGIVTEHWGVDGCPAGHKVMNTFWHLYNISSYIKQGYKLTQGEIIGKEGDTGVVNGPHLHFGVHIVPENYKFTTTTELKKHAVNPLEWTFLYPHQTIRKYPTNNLDTLIKRLPVAAVPPTYVTVVGELLEVKDGVYKVKGELYVRKSD